MKILFVGYKNPHFQAVTDYIEMALLAMGHEVRFADYRGYRLPGRLRDRVAVLQRWDQARINEGIRRAAREFRPELFLVNGGYTLEPETIRCAKDAGAITALWMSDFPALVDVLVRLSAHFDHYFLPGTDAVEYFRAAGRTQGRFLPFACLPELHRPVALERGEVGRFTSDVAFAGTPYPERVVLLEAISKLGVDLAVWGPGWDRLPAGHPVRRHVRGGAIGSADFVKAAAGCKIAFNFMGQPCVSPREELCNSRVFELLGCGAFQLVDAKKDVLRLFVSGRELVAFEDERQMLDQIRHYLSHGEQRVEVAKRGREAALAAHTYRHRLTELLHVCGFSS